MTASILETVDQIIKSNDHDVELEEISLDTLHFGTFSLELSQKLESLKSLEYLSLNDCGLENLDNFPKLANLIRLELLDNNLAASSLAHLSLLVNLQSLSLGGNKIDTLNDIHPLLKLTNLFQLDFSNCKICSLKGYRSTIFGQFPNLGILDNKDRDGFSIQYELLGNDDDIDEYDEEEDEEDSNSNEDEEENYVEDEEKNSEQDEEKEAEEELSKPRKRVKK